MNRKLIYVAATVTWAANLFACGDGDTTEGGPSTGGTSAGGTGGDQGGVGGGSGGTGGSSGSTAPPACDELLASAEAYKAAHPGNGGKDWDLLAKTPAQVAADPAAQALLSICGEGQLPIIPILAWEYGGADHQWVNPTASAVAYCVYTPANPSTEHWQYDAAADHVTADMYVKCPELNPCKDEQGASQVMNCLGDPTNIEIIVDTASLKDGLDVGLQLSEASTDLNLILPDGNKVHLYTGL